MLEVEQTLAIIEATNEYIKNMDKSQMTGNDLAEIYFRLLKENIKIAEEKNSVYEELKGKFK